MNGGFGRTVLALVFVGLCGIPGTGDTAPKQKTHGVGIDLLFGLFGSVESKGKIEPDEVEGPFGVSIDYEHELTPWLHAGPRVVWSLSESADNDHDYSNAHLGLQLIPTWKFDPKVHIFGLGSVGGSFMNRNDGGRDRTGWGYHLSVGLGAKLILRGMHLRFSVSHLRSMVDQIESEEAVGQPFTDRDIRMEHTSLGLGLVF